MTPLQKQKQLRRAADDRTQVRTPNRSVKELRQMHRDQARQKDERGTPETEAGRKSILAPMTGPAKGIVTRALILEKLLDRALDAQDPKKFQNALGQIADGIREMRNTDIPKLVDKLLQGMELTQKELGQDFDRNKVEDFMKAASRRR